MKIQFAGLLCLGRQLRYKRAGALRANMNILIVNLTRFGDLLQTQPLISGLTDQGHRVSLACLEQFAPAAELLADLKFIAPFPGSDLLKHLDEDWAGALSDLYSWRKELRAAFNPDLIVNLTPTLSARMLTRYLCQGEEAAGSSKEVGFMGFGVDRFGFMDNSNAWATYLQAASRTRGNSPCNLVDVFRKVCELGSVQPRYALGRFPDNVLRQLQQELACNTGQRLAEFPTQSGKNVNGYIGFQLGASDDRRRWPTAYFARLGDLFWRELGLMPILLGSKSERHLGERYAEQTNSPYLNLLGATDLPGLAAVLILTRLLVTNDTGTMHLAAGLNVPVLAIFLATAQAWDTAPYQEGALCLEPDLPDHPRPFDSPCPPGCACRTAILPETVFRFAKERLGSGVWPRASTADGPVRAWLTTRAAKEADPESFLDLLSLSGHEYAPRTFWLRSQRYFLRAHLDGRLAGGDGERFIKALPTYLISALSHLPVEFLEKLRAELDQAGAILHLLSEQGQALSINPLPVLKNRFMATWQRLQTLWDNSAYFNVLGLLWLAQTQEEGDDLGKVLALVQEYATLCRAWSASLTLPSANL